MNMAKTIPLPLLCSNIKCGRDVPRPITIHNLSLRTKYKGCPFCFTELPNITIRRRVQTVHEKKTEEECTKKPSQNEATHVSQQTEECSRQFGYLSERSKHEDIPEQCMTCPKIIECMRGT
jgi:hypothetical protein